MCLVWPVRPQFLNETPEFSRTGSGQIGPAPGSEPLSSPAPVGQSAGIGELRREKCTRAPLIFPFKLTRTSSFRPAKTDKWKETQDYEQSPVISTNSREQIGTARTQQESKFAVEICTQVAVQTSGNNLKK